MNTFKKILLLVCCLVAFAGFVKAQSLRAIAGPKGIWVVCGEALPKNFSYEIARQKNGGEWIIVAKVTMPASKDQIQADLVNVENAAGIAMAPLSAVRLQGVWDRITRDIITTSPPEMQHDLPLRCATGTAWYDANADSAVIYKYKVKMVGPRQTPPDIQTNIIKYPVERFSTDIRPFKVAPSRQGVYAEFEVVDKGQMVRCKILRSYYMRSGFELINAEPLFLQHDKKMFIGFADNTAVAKVPYTYAVLPIDEGGNPGFASPELRAFNVPAKSIIPSVHQFRAYSAEAKKAIRLGWKLDDPKNITSIDIYKSDSYDGQYNKIASVQAKDTSYFDYDVKPVNTYFYTIKLTGNYATSPTSPRIPGLMKATFKNLFPPQNIRLKQVDDKVVLSWEKNESDTHAYYVYRAGENGVMKQLGAPIITDSANVTYTDTPPQGGGQKIYSYAIADENTSYAIGPKSQPMRAYIAGIGGLPIPYNVSIRKEAGNKLMVIWPDMRRQSKDFAGYMVYRRVKTGATKGEPAIALTAKLIPAEVNNYIDTTGAEGINYAYTVKTVSMDGKILSSPSLEAGIKLAIEAPLNVSNIKLVPADKSVVLSWNNPYGQKTQVIIVYRAQEGQEMQQIASLGADVQLYVDKEVTQGLTYYYAFVVKDKKGRSSLQTDAVGLYLK
jgi:fibronectin type 3 domain-containing protein